MTTYNTGNPIGSKDPRDLYDNAENLDTAVNDTSRDTWKDRLGRSRKTMSGMERQFDAAEDYREATFVLTQADKQNRFNTFIASSGYQFLGDYEAGIEITEYNQVVRDSNGEFWRLSGEVELPYTTTGAGLPEDDSLTPLGDAVLRQELTNPDKGAAMVARGVVAVDSIADLLALPEGQKKEDLRYLVKGIPFSWDGLQFYPHSRVSVDAFGIYPGVVTPSSSVVYANDVFGTGLYWPSGEYLFSGAMTFSGDVDWSGENVVFKLSDDSHIGERWLRSNGSVQCPGFVFDGDNKVSKIWDARTSETNVHQLNFRGCTFKNGVQLADVSGDNPVYGHSAGLITFGGFSVVDLCDATFENFDALASEGENRPVSRGFAVADGANSPFLIYAHRVKVKNITCSNAPWGAFNIDADGIVYRNHHRDRFFFGDDMFLENCQKRHLKANGARNFFVRRPMIVSRENKPARTCVGFQANNNTAFSGNLVDGVFLFETGAFPTTSCVGFLSNEFNRDSLATIKGNNYYCPDKIEKTGDPASQPSIYGFGGYPDLSNVDISGDIIDIEVPYVATIRMSAISTQAKAVEDMLKRVRFHGITVKSVTEAFIWAARSGTGFAHYSLDIRDNKILHGEHELTSELSDSNVSVTYSSGTGKPRAGGNTNVPTIGRQGFVSVPPEDNQLLAEWYPENGSRSGVSRVFLPAVGSTPVPMLVTGITPSYSMALVHGKRTDATGGDNRHFTDLLLMTSLGSVEVVSSTDRNNPASRTYSPGKEVSVNADEYDIDILYIGFFWS